MTGEDRIRGRVGWRAQATPAESVDEAATLFDPADSARIRDEIVLLASWNEGEFHASQTATWPLREPNAIGAAVRTLRQQGLIERLNRDGEPELRASEARAAHGRASWVWRLTIKGWDRAAEVKRGRLV